LPEQAFERALSALSSMPLHFGNAFLMIIGVIFL
jgi:hypothetical protein